MVDKPDLDALLLQMLGYSRLSKLQNLLGLLGIACWGHVIMMLLPAFGNHGELRLSCDGAVSTAYQQVEAQHGYHALLL